MRHAQKITQFGNNIRALRKEKGWTQEKLADEAEIDIRTVQRIEKAELRPTIDVIISLCLALQVDISKLFEGIELTN